MKFLIYGHQGFIGKQAVLYLQQTEEVILGEKRADDEDNLEDEIRKHNPDRVISFAGRVRGEGVLTADYLEKPGKLVDNIRDNLYGPFLLATICAKLKIHFTYLGTGCIFDNTEDESKQFDESSKPNFYGSSYSVVKGFTDRMMHQFPNVLNVRIRMPMISEEHPLNLITKLCKYEKICSYPNSMTVLDELLPILIDLAKKQETGTINLTNPGVIRHNEILEMYKEIVDPTFTWKNFTIEEQNQILACQRSNNKLDTTKLEHMYPHVLPIKDSVRNLLVKMKASKK